MPDLPIETAKLIVVALQPHFPDLTVSKLINALNSPEPEELSEIIKPGQSLTVKDVAKKLKISVPSAYKLFHSGKLKPYYVNGCTRIEERDLVDYINRQKQGNWSKKLKKRKQKQNAPSPTKNQGQASNSDTNQNLSPQTQKSSKKEENKNE